jgi:DNA-directed RNA polymerase specialized sigma24 family protein
LGAGEGFEEFYGAAFGRLVGQLFLVTGDLHEAEDVVQEAFARAAERWSTIRTYHLPEAWIRRVALNLAASAARRRRWLAVRARLAPPPELPRPPMRSWSSSRRLAVCRCRSGNRWFCTTCSSCRPSRSPASWASRPGR